MVVKQTFFGVNYGKISPTYCSNAKISKTELKKLSVFERVNRTRSHHSGLTKLIKGHPQPLFNSFGCVQNGNRVIP